MTTKVLITGIAGFIGSHVVDFFSKRKYEVYGIDDFSTGKPENLIGYQTKIVELFEGSIVDPMMCIAALMKYKPEIVIHLAAQPSLLTSQKQPEFDAAVNVVGTLNMLKACNGVDVKRFVFASTSAITSSMIVNEHPANELPPPDSPYGLSKRSAELYIQQLYWEKSVILRFANVYGPKQVPLGENQLVPRILRHLMYGDEFEIYGDGRSTRDFIYVRDVAEAIFKVATRRKITKQICNIGTGKQTSVLDMARCVQEVLEDDTVFTHGEDRDGHRKHVRMIIENARSGYGWKAKTTLRDGITKTTNWWKHEQRESTHSR